MPERFPADPPVFGARVEGCPYVVRPSAYAQIRNAAGEFAVIRTPQGIYLPGGGIEADETAEAAVVREVKEEAGLVVKARARIKEAVEIVYSAEEHTCFEKRCVFVEAEVIGQVLEHEPDHELVWVSVDQALSTLSPESHRWAVGQYTEPDCPEHHADSSTRSWDAITEDWVVHADANDYRNDYLMLRMLSMLGDVKAKKILDLGCGEGGYTRELVRRGADAIGVDGSKRLINIARARAQAEGLKIRFIPANAISLDRIESNSLDVVMASMSLMDVEDYGSAIREVCRVLCNGGELVMSITHPCFSAPVSEWIRGHDGELQAFKVDRYFERVAWETRIAPAFRSTVLRRHRPLEDYMRAPIERGLRLQEFLEPSVTTEELKKSHRFRKLLRIPYFLFMRWQKA